MTLLGRTVLNAFKGLWTILATTDVITTLPFRNTLRKYAAHLATVAGNTLETITAGNRAAIPPFLSVALGDVAALLDAGVRISHTRKTIAAINSH